MLSWPAGILALLSKPLSSVSALVNGGYYHAYLQGDFYELLR